MAKNHEEPLIRQFWRKRGTIVWEFRMVPENYGKDEWQRGGRFLDALIIPGWESAVEYQARDGMYVRTDNPSTRPFTRKELEDQLKGLDLILVQAKNSRLGMSVMGQARYSEKLMARFQPKSLRSIIVCTDDDSALRPFANADGLEVFIAQAVSEKSEFEVGEAQH